MGKEPPPVTLGRYIREGLSERGRKPSPKCHTEQKGQDPGFSHVECKYFSPGEDKTSNFLVTLNPALQPRGCVRDTYVSWSLPPLKCEHMPSQR